MYFNRKNAEQKNWRMIKKGKHFLFGCSLVFAVGATLVAPSVKADTVEAKAESSSTTEGAKPVAAEENATYAAPAVEVAPAAVAGEKVEKPVETTQNSKEEPVVATEKAKEAAGVQLPSLTVVADSSALTEEEKANIVEAVKGVNPTATDVQVQADGSVVVTFADGSSANLSASQTVKVAAPAETSATQPKSRSRRAAGQERAQDRSMEGKDIKYVYQNRTAQVNSGTPTQRAKIEYRQLDDYEVVNGKTVPTDPSGQGRPVIEWTVTFNEAQYDKMGGFYYFTIPNNVSDPYNVVTDYDGAYVDRDGWKDANKESGAGSANAEGVQYIDAGNRLEWRVKNTVGNDYNNVDGLSGVMGNTKKVYVLQLSNNSSARKFTIKYRTVVEDSSQIISYIAGIESKTGLPRNNWYAISGKYDKHLVSQVATPSVTPNLTNTSVNVPVQTVASTSSTLSGTGTPGATIKLYIDGQEQNIGNVTVDNNGNWTTGELPTALNNNQGDGTTIKPRQTVQVSQTVNGTESSRRTVPVSVGVTTVEPSSLTTNQAAVVAGQKEVTLKVPHDAGIAYMRYTNTAGQSVEIPVKRDNLSAAWTSQKPEAATVKSIEKGKFQDTIVLTMADKIAGTEVAAISNVMEGGFSSVADWQPRGVENQAPTIASAVEGNKKTVAQGAQLDLASLVTVADKEDDAQATLGDKVHAEVVSVNGNAATKTVDTNTQGTYTVKYKAVDSQGKESGEIEVTVVVNPARDNVAPTVEIPYSDPAPNKKEVYLYTGEEADVDITFNDDSGKIKSASLKKGGNIALNNIDGNPDKQDNEYGYTVTAINSETATPAKIKVTGQVSGIAAEKLPKTENDSLDLVTRFATATDTDGALINNTAVKTKKNGEVVGSYLTDPGAVTFVLKAQTKKYDIKTPSEADKVAVSDANNVTDKEFEKIKEKVKVEYSQNNPDARLADKKGQEVEDASKVVDKVEKDGNNVVVTYKDGSKDTKPLTDFARTNVAPTVEIPYSDPAPNKKEVYLYTGEEADVDITFNDDSGKIKSASLKKGGNIALNNVDGNPEKQDNEWGYTVTAINSETNTPAKIKVTGQVSGIAENRLPKTESDSLELVTRFATATDTDGAEISNNATKTKNNGEIVGTYLTDPGAVTFVLKAQTKKYDIKTPSEADKVTVSDANNVTDKEFEKIKEKVKVEYSQNNPDARLADKKGKEVEDASKVVDKVEKEGNNVVITYKDGSKDTKPLSEFVNVAPTVELPYSNQANKQIYVYTGENTDLTFKGTDEKEVKDLYLRGPGDVSWNNANKYGFTTGKVENGAVTGEGSVSEDKTSATIKMTGTTNLKAGQEWTSFIVSKDNNGELSNTDYRALDVDPNAKEKPGYVRFVVKNQTSKYDIATPAPADKVEVADPTKVTDAELDKIKEKLQIEYAQTNDDANFADKKGKTVDAEDAKTKIKSVEKDNAGNLVVTYTDGSTDKKPLSDFVVKDTTAPAKPEVKTDLTGKAGTKDPVEVTAEPGSTVELFDKDGNSLGTGVANDQGVARITPTKAIPAGDVTAKATDPAGNTSDASEPKVATDTTAPAKPEVKTDLTGKAGTKDPVEVTAEPGSTVELFDKDGNSLGTGVANDQGVASITPTKEIPAGDVTAKATDKAGNTSDASAPKVATDTTAPAKPEVKTDLTGKAGTKDPVEVTAEPGSTVELFDKDGNSLGTAKADENGVARITPTKDIPAGDVTAKATDPAGNTSDASEPKVATDTTAPAKPEVKTDLTGKAGTKDPVEVTAEPGSTVELFDKDGNSLGTAKADENGVARITPTKDIPAGDVTAKATDPAGNTSDASEPKVATDTTAPAKPEVKTDLTGKAGTKDPVEVTAEPGSTVELFDKDGNSLGTAKADENGVARITPTKDIPAGGVTAKATDPAGNTSDASEPKVATDTTAPAKPEVKTDLTGKAGTKDPVEVTAEPGSTVELFDKDGNSLGTGVANDQGVASITPTKDIPAGDVTAKATDKAGNTSDASAPKVATDTTAPAKPEVKTDLTGKAGTKDPVEVTAEPGSTVELFDKDGNSLGTAKADENGVARITPTKDIPAGDVTAKATDPSGNTSDASEPKVATDTTAPAKPEVKTDLTGKAGTKDPVEVTAEPGSTVELFDKDGNSLGTAKADENGVARITPTKDIPAGDVTAKATDPSGNTSDASEPKEATVATDADKNTPVAKDQTVKPGDKPNAKDSIDNVGDLPEGTTVEFKTPVDTTTPGDKGATVVVTYPDGSKDEVPVKVTVKDPEKTSDAENNTPTPKDQTVKPGDTPNAKDSIDNVGDLPEGTKVEFKTPVDTTTPGEKDATVVVTYPDGSQDEVPVKVTVKEPTDADKNTPTAKDQTVKPGDKPNAKDSIGNVGDLPEGTKVEFKTPVDTTTPGEKDATVVVTYPDGSQDEVPVKVTVKEPTDADKNTPTAKDQTVKPGDKPSAKDSIGNVGDLPEGTKVEFKTPVDTTTPGDKGATVVVTYPDGSKDEVPVKVTVKDPEKTSDAENNTPTPKAQTVKPGDKPSAKDSIGNVGDLPEDTKVEFKTPVDTTTPGEKDATVVVTYPDGSQDEVPVKVTVSEPTDADKNEPKAKDQTVKVGEEPKAEDAIENFKGLPEGTTAKFKEPVDTTTPGEKSPVVVVTYPDGSTEEVPVKVTVSEPTDADKNEPKAKDQTVKVGEEPKAEDAIENFKGLPEGTTAKFKEPVDTTTPGDKSPVVVVTYPDGSTEEVPVKVTVSEPTDADKNEPKAKDQAVKVGEEPKAEDSIENFKGLPEGTTAKFKQPVDTTTPGDKSPVVVVTYPDGSTEEVPVKVTVKDPSTPATDSGKNKVTDPTVTPVTDPSNLTDAEKAKVADEVKKANPTAKDVEVGNDGTTTVTYPDGTTAVIPADKTVKKSDDKAVKDPAVTPVTDPSNLTDAEKAKVADEVKKANPTAKDVEVGKDGTTTVTFPDGSKAEIPAAKTVKKSADKAVKDPSVTPVTDPSNLTDAEKAKVADEVKKANPTAKDVEVGNDGTTTVTYPDGTTAVIPADKTVKKSDDKAVKDPAVTPVTDPSNLTDAEKAKVADEVKKANPTAKDVEVGKDGTTTVTFPDGSKAEIPAAKTVKKSADKAVKDPSVTPVTDPSNLTDAEKAKVADEVKKANPTAKDVEVGKDGTTTVTFPDGTTAVIPADKTVKKSADKELKDPTVTPVTDPSNLTDAEKAKVADEVKKSNPTVTDVKVDKDGTTTVTYPDGTTAVIPADKTVKKSDDKVVTDPTVTPVTDPSNLTDAEKAKVADEVKKSNPTVTDVKVDKDGTTTVTYPDGTTAVIPADKTVKKSDDKVVTDPTVTPVTDPSNLTDAEKAKVADEVKKANPTVTDVKVDEDGTTTVTYPDGTTAVIPADKTVKKSDDKVVMDPAVTPVVDPSNLTDAEKAKVADEVKKANPSVTDVKIDEDGTTTVAYPDGTTAVIPADKTVKKSDDKVVMDPAVTPVVDPSNLTDAEKAKVADEVKKANPTVTDVKVDEDGATTVTYPDGTTAVIPGDKTVKKSADKELKDPTVTPVADPSNLTDAEKAKVADEVKKTNPTVTDVTVGNDGATTVTYPDGTTAVIPSDKTVKKSDDNGTKNPAVTPVADPSNLTDADKAKVADEVKKANPTVTDVTVGNDGTATVTYPDGTTAVIPADKTVKKSADKAVKDPSVIPVADPSNLTDAEKAKVAEEVKKANPTVTDVEVDKDGTTTVTYPDGTTAVIPADKTVKKSADKVVTNPTVTPVTDPSNLTDAEKAKVAEEVKKSTPTVTDVKVDKDGTTTVTYPDGTTAVIPADKTVKKSADKVVTDPSVTPVTDPSNLTDAEKAKVADEVKKANPTVTDVKVDKDGTTTVTYPDGTTAVIPADKTVKKSADKVVTDPSVTPVTDPSNLTDAEKAKVADEVKKSTPTVTDVKVDKDGTTTVTYPDGTTAVIPADKTVKKSADKSVKDPSVTPVTDPSNLTDAEKAKVAEEVKKSNPTVTDVKVDKDGTTTVTYPDGTTAVIPADKTVKKSADKSVKDPSVTPVTDPSNLTDAEKAKVAEEVKKSNPTVTDVKVGKDGTTTVTYPDGTTAVIPADKTVKKSADKAVKDPSVTPVTDPSNLTDAEKAKVADEVKKSNPTVTDVKVDKDGTTTVTYADGTTAVIPADKTVKKSADKAVKDPSVTPVTDPSNLTDAEKAKVADEVKKSNPTVTDVKVGKDGTTTVTYADGTTAVIPSDKTVKKSADKLVANPTVTPVTDPSNLTDAEKAKVADEVKKANPTATDVKVNKDGSVVVTFKDGTVAVIPADKTVKKSADKVKESDGVKNPTVTPVTDPSNLTDAEKAKVANEVKKANPTATDIKVNNDGSVVVTFEDGTTAVIPADKTVKKSSDKVKESDGVKNPSVTPVTDPSNLTDAEKAKVADEVKKANPTAKDIKVNNDGSVVVTFEDGSVAVIPAEKAVTAANQDSPAQAPAKKAGAKELPNTGTEQSNASLGLALLAAATGGLLFAKKRKEEE